MTDAWTQALTLAGKHVTLRPLQRSDREGLVAAFHGMDDVFTTFVPSEETIDGWFDQLDRERDAGRAIPFCVLDAAGQVSGTTRFMRISSSHRRSIADLGADDTSSSSDPPAPPTS